MDPHHSTFLEMWCVQSCASQAGWCPGITDSCTTSSSFYVRPGIQTQVSACGESTVPTNPSSPALHLLAFWGFWIHSYQRYRPAVFFQCGLFALALGWCLPHKMSLDVSLLFWERVYEDVVLVNIWRLVELHQEATRCYTTSWSFLFPPPPPPLPPPPFPLVF